MQYRQGDVLITKATIPSSAKRRIMKQVVLAEGEVTGHCHQIKSPIGKCTPYVDDSNVQSVLYLRVRKPVQVEHEEHDTATLEPGEYIVKRQVEYWLDEVRQVMD